MSFDKDEFGFIVGSLKSKACILYRRGATRLEIMAALGNDHYNVLRELETMGYKIIKKKVRVGKNRPHFRYRIGGKSE